MFEMCRVRDETDKFGRMGPLLALFLPVFERMQSAQHIEHV